MLTSDSKKNIKTIKDLINSNPLVKDGESLNNRICDAKAGLEAIEFNLKKPRKEKTPNN